MGTTLDYLIVDLHECQKIGDLDKIIEAELKLAEYHYNNSNFLKARIFLKSILRKRKHISNIYYYLALIDINENSISSAIENLNSELKINPKNEQAIRIKEKLVIHKNFPIMTIFFAIVNILFFIFTFPEISLINSIRFGVSSFNLSFFSAITSIFFHINIFHFLINFLILILFGSILEKGLGSVRFFFIYIISGVLGNILQAMFSDGSIVLGASGALFGILGALMMREPLLKVRLFGILQIPIIFLLGLFFSFSLIGNFFLSTDLISGELSHMMGIFVGIFIVGILYHERISTFYNWIFIVSGFGLISYVFNSVISYGFKIDIELIFNLIILIFSILIITYSYIHLKTMEAFRR